MNIRNSIGQGECCGKKSGSKGVCVRTRIKLNLGLTKGGRLQSKAYNGMYMRTQCLGNTKWCKNVTIRTTSNYVPIEYPEGCNAVRDLLALEDLKEGLGPLDLSEPQCV